MLFANKIMYISRIGLGLYKYKEKYTMKLNRIDCAFLDRADFCLYIGLPGVKAIYTILQSCLEEMMRVKYALP
jgi:hypothetical protein